MGNEFQLGLKCVHFLAFAALVGTHLAQLVAYSYCKGRSSDQRAMTLNVILRLEKSVMPVAGTGLLLSGIGLAAREGVQNFSQMWIIVLMIIWLAGFIVANFIGVPALRVAHREAEARSDFVMGNSLLLRWRNSAVFGITILTIATLVAVFKP